MKYLLLLSLFSGAATPSVIGMQKNTININDEGSLATMSSDDAYEQSYDSIKSPTDENLLRYRVYIDRDSDDLPSRTNTVDWNYRNDPKRGTWNSGFVEIVSFDTATQDLESIKINYNWLSNLWNSSKGWTVDGGKDASLTAESTTYELKHKNAITQIKLDSASSHDDNEKTKLEIHEMWDGTKVELQWIISVLFDWANLSMVSHAALAELENTGIESNGGDEFHTVTNTKTSEFTASVVSNQVITIDLKNLFDMERTIYKKALAESWKNWSTIQSVFVRTGVLSAPTATGHLQFVHLFSEPLWNDLNTIAHSGLQTSGKFELLPMVNGVVWKLTYINILGEKVELGTFNGLFTSIPNLTWTGIDNSIISTLYEK
jgi:hypothetical protein